MKKLFSIFGFAVLFTVTACAQDNKTKPSPAESVSGKINDANITINYSSPAVKGRKIWGELVPYGQVWRAGANEATTFKTDKDLTVESKTLPAGEYSFFAIPTEKEWTVIFNKIAKQWGAYKYNQAEDALRVTVMPKKAPKMSERLKYVINKSSIALRWENLEVPVSIK